MASDSQEPAPESRPRGGNRQAEENQVRDPSAPPGAVCASHPERDAHFTCPRCGDHACVFCWHPSLQRCDACLKRDPAGASPPVPWESGVGGFGARFFGTLAGAFSPARTAPSFARSEVRAAVRFLLLSALPMSLLAGIVPNTRTLLFEGAAQVRVLENPTQVAIALDVLRAMAGQVALDGAKLLGCALPFISLIRAYGGPESAPYALRMLFYRAWLYPCSALLFYALVAVLPAELSGSFAVVVGMLRIGAEVLFMMAMAYVARLACGVGMGWSIAIVMVAVTVAGFVAWGANEGLMYALPPLPAMPEA